MGGRYWLWVVARLVVAIAIVAWAASFLGTGGGEKEFQKTLEAMKQVRSFRVAYSATQGANHQELLWEIDCDQDIWHHQSHYIQTTSDSAPTDFAEDQITAGGHEYDRINGGAWTQSKYYTASAKAFCNNLSQGNDSNVLPPIATMIKRGIIQKGDKKTVGGVRCREWLVTMKGGMSGLEHDKVCLGLEDHLPYEMSVDYMGSHSSFSDYNTHLQIDLPEAALQNTSTSAGSN